MSKSLCPYSKECPVFKGEEKVSTNTLALYKNVFCCRGENGWRNCESYCINYKNRPNT